MYIYYIHRQIDRQIDIDIDTYIDIDRQRDRQIKEVELEYLYKVGSKSELNSWPDSSVGQSI